jgi:hypothetical protein
LFLYEGGGDGKGAAHFVGTRHETTLI